MLSKMYHYLWIVMCIVYKLSHSKMVFNITMYILNKENQEYIRSIRNK